MVEIADYVTSNTFIDYSIDYGNTYEYQISSSYGVFKYSSKVEQWQVLKSDTNKDGQCNELDLTHYVNKILNKDESQSLQINDLNGDNTVNVQDLIDICKK